MTRFTWQLGVLVGIVSLGLVSLMRPASPSHAAAPSLLVEEPILEVHDASLTSYLATGSSSVQDIRPLVEQRGVNLEGSVRAPAAFPWGMAGNPFEREWAGETSPVMNLATGTARITDIDLLLAAPGFGWPIGRTYNAHQEASGGSHRDSNSYQGQNWHQLSQPEIVLYEGGGSYDDVVYLIYGADRFIEFAQVDQSTDTFKATNGAAGVIEFAAGATNEPDTYTYTDQLGNQTIFFGFDADADPAEGQLWKVTDNASNTAYVGDATTGSTAIANGYDGSGRILYAYDTADRRYTYTYTTLNGTDRLTEVKAETKTGGTWASPTGLATVGEVDYAYYGDETYGDIGDLKTVTLTIPQTDSGIDVVKTKYYRYWEGTFNATTNPGHPHALKLVVDFEGVRQYDWQDSLFDDDFLTASHATLEPYSSAYFEYDSSHRVNEAWFNGECGCGGGTNGTHEYEYETNGSYSDGTGYDTTWATRTVVQRPDGSYVTQYFDEVAQPLSRVVTDIDPDSTNPAPDKWVSYVVRTSDGLVQDLHTPANVTGYTHSTGAVTTSTTAGLVRSYVRETSSTAATKGYKLDRKWKEGTSGSAYFEKTWTYETASLAAGDSTVYQAAVASVRDYTQAITSGTTGSVLTSIDTTWRTSSLSREKVDVTLPAVGTSNNGSGSSNTRHQYFNADGTLAFTKNEDGIIAYREYTNGKLSKRIEDADTTKTGAGEDFNGISIPTGFSSSGSPVHR